MSINKRGDPMVHSYKDRQGYGNRARARAGSLDLMYINVKAPKIGGFWNTKS